MTELTPAAQAMLDAITAVSPAPADEIAAVALRAAADQVVPPDPCGDDCCIRTCEGIRADLLAIAAELEGHHG